MRNESSTRALEVARAKLDEQLKKTPDDPKLLLMRARADERLEQYPEAARFFRRAATLLQRSGDVIGSIAASIESATSLAHAGEFEESIALFDYGIARYDQLNEFTSAALTRIAYAKVLVRTKETTKAWETIALAIDALEQGGYWTELGWAYENLAAIASDNGDPTTALEHAKAAVECAAKAKDRAVFGKRLSVVARLHLAAGRFGKARQYQERAQSYLRDGGDTLGLLSGYETLAAAALGNHEPESSEKLIKEAILLADDYGKPQPKGRLRVKLAELLFEKEEDRSAKEILDHGIDLLHTAGDPRTSAPAFILLARICWRLGEREYSLRALRRAEQLFRAVGDEPEAARVVGLLAAATDGRWSG